MKTHRRKAVQTITPESPEGLDIGLHETTIPGGQNHLVNHPLAHFDPPKKADSPYYSGMMAHGVYVPNPPYDGRIAPNKEFKEEHAATHKVKLPENKTDSLPPVRVIVVPDTAKGHPLSTVYTNRVQVTTDDPVSLCARDGRRKFVHLLNEDTSNNVRFSTEWPTVNSGGGAILPSKQTSYIKLECQDTLYAIADGGTGLYVSIILETVIDAAVP